MVRHSVNHALLPKHEHGSKPKASSRASASARRSHSADAEPAQKMTRAPLTWRLIPAIGLARVARNL